MAQLLSNLPIGALVKFGSHSVGSEAAQPIIWMIVDKNHSGYPSNSITVITEKIIDLRAYDGSETTSSMGNKDYKLSNIHQWLNSAAGAGAWYSPTHVNDAPPNNSNVTVNTGYESRPGFLYHFTNDERRVILPTTLKAQLAEDVSSTFTAKVFLPSKWEVLGSSEYADGSSKLSYFSTGDLRAKITEQAFTYTSCTANYRPTDINAYWSYHTRSTADTTQRVITELGKSSGNYAYNGDIGVRPLMNLSPSTKISDTTDAQGCYTVLPQSIPSISGANSDFGTKAEGFSTTYTVTDVDNDTVTVTEYIDNIAIRSYVATLGAENKFSVTGTTWLKLANGTHTLKIAATDGFDTDTRVYTFTKSVTKLVVQRTTPIESSNRPSQIIVTVVKNIPYDAIMTVEVCNNGFDANPTWENIGTSSVSSSLAYEFENETCTSGKWGVNIRVTVDRNGGEGACYITEIGGNFE